MASRLPVLIVTRNLPPIRGGIERLMQRVVEALSQDFECHVLGPAGCSRFLPPEVRVTELPAKVLWFYLLAAPAALLLRLRHRFALCVAGNGLVAPLAAFAAGLSGSPWLAFVHGLDLVERNAIYQTLFVPWLRRAQLVIANSRYTADAAETRGVAPDRIVVVHPGVALPAVIRANGGPGVLLSVGRLVARKGIAEFVEHAFPQIVAQYPDVQYVVVGEEPTLAAGGSSGGREHIAAAARRAGVAAHVHLAGALPDAELEAAYGSANVLVFPSLGSQHDPEGFGMVILEAAAHGVPTVAFDVGGVGDAVSSDNGVLVSAADYARFADAVIELLKRPDRDVTIQQCRRHALQFGWGGYTQRVRELSVTVAHA